MNFVEKLLEIREHSCFFLFAAKPLMNVSYSIKKSDLCFLMDLSLKKLSVLYVLVT